MNDKDHILLTRIKNHGDEKAFEYIFHYYFQQLCNFAFGFLKDKAEAEDIVNDCFFEFWTKREMIDIKSSLKSYLFISVRNAAINKLRKHQIESKFAQEQIYLSDYHEDINRETERLLRIEELEERLNAAIEKLPQQCKYIFYLNRYENMSYKDIAKKMDISPGTVKTQIGRALHKLRSELSDIKSILFSIFIPKQNFF